MKVRVAAELALKVLGIGIFANAVAGLGIATRILRDLPFTEELRLVFTLLVYPAFTMALLWLFSGKIAKLMFKEDSKNSEVALALTEDTLLRLFISALGAYTLTHSIPAFISQGLQLLTSSPSAIHDSFTVRARTFLFVSLIQIGIGVYMLAGASHLMGLIKKLGGRFK